MFIVRIVEKFRPLAVMPFASFVAALTVALVVWTPPAFAKTVATKTARCTILFTINIEVSGPDASQDVADRWKREIEHRWNGPTVEMIKPVAEEYGLDLTKPQEREKADTLARALMEIAGLPAGHTRVNGCNVRVEVNIKVGKGTPGYHQIRAIPDTVQVVDKAGKERTEYEDSEVRGSPNAFFKSLEGEWTSGERRTAADHEAGHLLAERDMRDEIELVDPATDRKERFSQGVHPGHELDIMAHNTGVKWPMEATFQNAMERGEVKCDCTSDPAPYAGLEDLWRDVHRWEDHLDYALKECSANSLATALENLRRIEDRLVDLNTTIPWVQYNLLRLKVRKAIQRGDPNEAGDAPQAALVEPAANNCPPESETKPESEAGSAGTGITVAVADVFGAAGLRVIPAPGVVVRVLDASGNEVATATTGDEMAADFIGLAPGEYTLRLEIGEYKPALPPQCTDGYVTTFKLAAGEKKRFATRVYSATVADNGQSIGTVSGECIKER